MQINGLVIASRQEARARRAAAQLHAAYPDVATRIAPVWGDVFMRADWQRDGARRREAILTDRKTSRRLIADILDPLDEDIIRTSLLTQIITGAAPGLDGWAARIVVDCMNTATAVSYQNVYAIARRLADLAEAGSAAANWPEEVAPLLGSLYVPQLVRHVQLLYEAMRRAGTEAYVKVGTSGTGGMGFNIPYTHGEEKPSRLLLSKAALAGAQTLLTFLMARTPGGPTVVKEVKPAALIGWRDIGYGPIRHGGREVEIYDCPPDQAVSTGDASNLVSQGEFGERTGETLHGVYIDTGENGRFSAAEFAAITAPGQMQLVTPEEVARNVVREILGGNTGRDVIAALDGSVMGPSARGGYLRQAALNRLAQLEAEHGESVAFEILGPPRLSKLLFEAHLLKRACGTIAGVLRPSPDALARQLEALVLDDADTRRRIISIGIPILLSDGERLLRGPVVKSVTAPHGWVDLTPGNTEKWQQRLNAVRQAVRAELGGDTSSRHDRGFTASRDWSPADDTFDIGEVVGWIFSTEDEGRRGKS
jgi:hypothetical protein